MCERSVCFLHGRHRPLVNPLDRKVNLLLVSVLTEYKYLSGLRRDCDYPGSLTTDPAGTRSGMEVLSDVLNGERR